MARQGTGVKETRFENARLNALGIEPMFLDELRAKVSDLDLCTPERVAFYMLMLVTSGEGVHTVDFEDWSLSSGTLLFVRPGQVQQWHPADGLVAQIVLIDPATLPSGLERSSSREGELLALFEWQTCIQLSEGLFEGATESLQRLRFDFDHFDASELDITLIRHELLALLLRLARWQRNQEIGAVSLQKGHETYRLFIKELEKCFQSQHSLQYYAKRLGYAQSTLSRACLAAEGRSAKVVIDRRVALEAQRMLTHSTSSVAEIAHQMGFSESTNFVKFFRRVTGATPAEFRKNRMSTGHQA